MVARIIVFGGFLASLLSSASLPAQTAADTDFQSRCSGPGVLRCIDFDSTAWFPHTGNGLDRGYNFGLLTGRNTTIDTTVKASGGGSMKHLFPAGGSNFEILTFFAHFAPCAGAGSNPVNCSQPFATGGLNTGDQIYIQWRARYSAEMLNDANFLDSGGQLIHDSGFKIADVGLADTPSCKTGSLANSLDCPTTCPNQGFELVVTGGSDVNLVGAYANCTGPYAYHGMRYTPDAGRTWSVQNMISACSNANGYANCRHVPAANEWLTFKLYLKMGHFNTFDNEVKFWMGRQGQPLEKLIDCSAAEPKKCDFEFDNTAGIAANGVLFNLLDPNTGQKISSGYQIGKFYLLPYMTNLSRVVSDATVWYDELIMSTQDIADPGGSPVIRPGAPTNLTTH